MEQIAKPNTFKVAARLPSLNDYINACRTHWATGAKMKQETEELIIWAIKSAQAAGLCRPVSRPVEIDFVWYEKSRKRDLDNIYSAKKYILDAMQTAGIIKNDSRAYVVGLHDHIIEGGTDGVEVRIYEVIENDDR